MVIKPLPGAAAVPIDIELKNISGKTVTAIGLVLVSHYPDSQERQSDVSIDRVGSIIESNPDKRPPFLPGTVEHTESSVGLGPAGSLPLFVEGRVTMVIFADRTAVGDTNVIRAALVQRSSEARYYGGLVTDLRAALADPDIVAAFTRSQQEGVARLRGSVNRLMSAEPAQGQVQGEHYKRISELRAVDRSLMAGKAAFDASLRRLADLQAGFDAHSSLRGGQ